MIEILKGKNILIGKEPGHGRLLVSVGADRSMALGSSGCVPNSVSRCKPSESMAHAKISVDHEGNMVLVNINPYNVTFVNGTEIATKRIDKGSRIEFGKDRYSIDLKAVLKAAEKLSERVVENKPDKKEYDISHLKNVWETYELELDRIVHRQQDMGKKRMLPIMVGSLSGVASPLLATLVAVNTLYLTVPIAAFSFGLYFINYRKKDTSYEERKIATEIFTDEYVCPNPDCNKFLGNLSYKLLKKQYSMHCPHCKCSFIERYETNENE